MMVGRVYKNIERRSIGDLKGFFIVSEWGVGCVEPE
jgi:hypothetical protein